jgi:hypothetical protein
MFDNHGYKNIVTYLTGVTKRSIRPKKSSENHWFQNFFFYPYPRSAQNIETAGVQEGGNDSEATICHLDNPDISFVLRNYRL